MKKIGAHERAQGCKIWTIFGKIGATAQNTGVSGIMCTLREEILSGFFSVQLSNFLPTAD